MRLTREFLVEPENYVQELICQCCGRLKKRVSGFVHNGKELHARYYALLNVTEEKPRIGLTLSIGRWQDDVFAERRKWIHLDVLLEKEGELDELICPPADCSFYPWEEGGQELSPDEAVDDSLMPEFWKISDFILNDDPVLRSYLMRQPLNVEGREIRPAKQETGE